MGDLNDPLPMDHIREAAEQKLTAEAIPDVENGKVEVEAIREELEYIEESAERLYATGNINGAWRNGILTVVVGLRKTLDDAEGG